MKDFKKELIRRYRDNKATEEELEVFFQLMNQGSLEKDLAEVMEESVEEKTTGRIIPIYKRNWFRIAAAAVLIIMVGATFFLLNQPTDPQPVTNNQQPIIDIAPGGNKAILTLADNTQIILDNAANGDLTNQGNVKVIKLDGQLAYNSSGNSTEVLYNTITTPRGGQYQLILADNSKVWLNAESSLRFPASFVGKERRVELTGEGYFEVAKNASMPFRVHVAGKGEVEVLGTHFNINSYNDESTINTTLLEGKVKITPLKDSRLTTQDSRLLTPGQQARLNSDGSIKINSNVDIDEVMAWKNGKFIFQDLDIQSIMRQISKWYNVDVEFKGTITKELFVGVISRNVNVSEIIKMLEKTGAVKLEIEGKKIIVK